MILKHEPRYLRFGPFELDLHACELEKNGHRIRLQGQPAKLLALLATHAGELVTRAEIQKELWEDGQFVEFEHAINVAVKKIRRALQDDSEKPRYVETLPRKGYRFIAQVEEAGETRSIHSVTNGSFNPDGQSHARTVVPSEPPGATGVSAPLSVPLDEKSKREFRLPLTQGKLRFLFLLIQVGYLTLYCTTLLYLDALEGALTDVGFVPAALTLQSVIVIAMCSIAVRIYLLSEVGWAHPEAGRNFRRLFPLLLVLDALW